MKERFLLSYSYIILFFCTKGVHVKLIKMAKHPKFDEILQTLRLQVRVKSIDQ